MPVTAKAFSTYMYYVGAFEFNKKVDGGGGLACDRTEGQVKKHYLAIAEKAVEEAKVGVNTTPDQAYFDAWSRHSTTQHDAKELVRVKKKRKAAEFEGGGQG